MRHPLLCTALTVTLVAGVAAVAAADSRYVAISGYSEGPVVGAPTTTYALRASYLAPAKWKAAKAKRGAITRRFGPVGSCKFKITVKARAVADVTETAATRVTRLLPASRRYLREEGTRNNSAWRVIRATGSDTTTGILVRPAPSVRAQPPGKRVWLELRAVGTADPTTECHSGGPRSVASEFGVILATGALGGFEPNTTPAPPGPPPPA
jgi:hypothetical protein